MMVLFSVAASQKIKQMAKISWAAFFPSYQPLFFYLIK